MNDKDTNLKSLEVRVQKFSLITSLVAFGLMFWGLADILLHRRSFSLPGDSVLQVSALLHISQSDLGLVAMSVGILLLSFLPAVQVLLAIILYLFQRHILNTLVTLLVLLELIISIWLGG